MRDKKNLIVATYLAFYILVALIFSFTGGGYYTYNSDQKLRDLIQADIWLVLSILMAILIYYSSISDTRKFWGWVLTLSIYFVVLYALLYKGTNYGLNGHWGDNGNRLALVTKFREFSSPFQDWYFKGLPSFYPPLWFYVWGKLSWLFGFEGYRTIKIGYFVIYALYPIGLFYVWKKLTSLKAAFLITFLTIYLHDVHLDYVYYEHITAAFFIPWWFYYIEDIKSVENKTAKWYLLGGLLGALIFLTYYYWFFIGFLAFVLRILLKPLLRQKAAIVSGPLKSKIFILATVALLSSVFWLPLIISIFHFGADSMQNKWFSPGYLDFNVPFFGFSLISYIFLTGLIYLAFRHRSKLNRSIILLLLGMLLIILIDRIFNLNEASIQTRKVRELLPVFLAVPSGFGLVLLYRILSRWRPYLRRVMLSVFVVALYFLGNSHTAMTSDKMWQIAIDSRVPTEDLKVFEAVDYRGKVFLTQRYLEAVYLPYYLFVCPNGATAHIASRYHQRIAMLQYLGRLNDPAQVAYLLKRNRFDTVDYFYLPIDAKKKIAYYDMYPLYFPGKNIKFTLEFPSSTTTDSKYFIRKHNKGLYEVIFPEMSVIETFRPNVQSPSLSQLMAEYNRLKLAVTFLPRLYGDSLSPFLSAAETAIKDSVSLKPIFRFDKDISLTDFTVASDSDTTCFLRLVFLAGKRVLSDFSLFVHAYPEDTTLLSPADREKKFTNLEISMPLPTSKWIEGEYILIENKPALTRGRYKFHIGFFDKGGRLPRSYWTPVIDIGATATKK
jgi:galactan 5-O-arabinofuranosyltransferase